MDDMETVARAQAARLLRLPREKESDPVSAQAAAWEEWPPARKALRKTARTAEAQTLIRSEGPEKPAVHAKGAGGVVGFALEIGEILFEFLLALIDN